MKTVVYMLCGLPGSGKTTCAKELEKKGAERLTLDEELFNRFGREFPSERYDEYETTTKSELREVLKTHVAENRPVVLDYGFWKKSARDEYKELITNFGGEWKLLYLKAPIGVLKKRLAARNTQAPDKNHRISEELLEKFVGEFEAPEGEGEEIIESSYISFGRGTKQ